MVRSILALGLAGLAAGVACPGSAASESRAERHALHEIALAEDMRHWSDGVLAGYLKDRDADVRARAALAVGRLQDSSAVPVLIPLTGDAAAPVRREAVFALGQIGKPAAGAALAACLQDPDPETQDLAIEALGKLGDKTRTSSIVPFLGHASARLRGEAAVALWRLADSSALAPLIQAHQDPDAEVRWRVLYALEKIPDPGRAGLVAAFHLEDPSPRVRAFAARNLGRQKSARFTAYLTQALSDEDVDVVVAAERALQAIGDTSAAGPLERCLAHRHPYVRLTAAGALGELAAPRSAETLAAHLRDPDAATRGGCARSLLRLDKGAAFERVRAVFEDSSIYARAAALEGLRYLPAAAALPRLREGLADSRPLLERITCAETLKELGSPEALEPLRRGIADPSSAFAAATASALAALKDTASLPRVTAAYLRHLSDSEPDARQELAGAMKSLGSEAYADSVLRAHPAPLPAATDYGADFEEPAAARGCVLHTSAGDIIWEFYREEAVQTVKNFLRLARKGYFDGLLFHRVVPAFVIQDGDSTGTGWGGPGYTIRCEYNRLRYDPGMVGMALSGKDTGGSQYFITHTPQMHLNGRYTIFAHVTRGMDVVGRIVQGDRILRVEAFP